MGSPFKLRNGRLFLVTEAPGGIYNSSQLKMIANLCEEDAAIIKATEDQRIAIFIEEDKVEKTAKALQSYGLGIRKYQEGLHQPVACVGELCPEFKQDAQGAAMMVTEALSDTVVEQPLRIGINGCERCCVPCHTLDISVVGDDHGYRISLGGKSSQIPEMATYLAEGVPAQELPKFVNQIVQRYKENAEEQESLQDLIERQGLGSFIDALAPYSRDASGEDFAADDSVMEDQTPALENDGSTLELESMDLEDLELATEAGIDEISQEPQFQEDLDGFDSLSPNEMMDQQNELDDVEISPTLNHDLGTVVHIDQGDSLIGESDLLGEMDDLGTMDDLDPTMSDAPLSPAEAMNLQDLELDGMDLADENLIDTLPEASLSPEEAIDSGDLVTLEESEQEIAMVEMDMEQIDGLDLQSDELLELELSEDLSLQSDETLEDEVSSTPSITQTKSIAQDIDDEFVADEVDETFEDELEDKLSLEIDKSKYSPDESDENQSSRDETLKLVEHNAHQEDHEHLVDGDSDYPALNALDFTKEGKIAIQLNTGATMTFDPATMATRSTRVIKISGLELKVTSERHRYVVEVDGLTMELPIKKAA
jgi:hypothetical protein